MNDDKEMVWWTTYVLMETAQCSVYTYYDGLNFRNVFWENTEWVSEEILTCACIRIKIKVYTVMMEFPQTKWKTNRLNKLLVLLDKLEWI